MVFKKGNIPWIKGKKSHRRGLTLEKEYGKEKAKILREKNRLGHLNQKSWNKGKKCPQISKALKGRKFTKEWREKLSKIRKDKFKQGLLPKFIGGKEEINLAWRGGISFEPYDKTFNNKFKRAIRKRDNQVCMVCGIHREKLLKALIVHHINYNKLLSIPQNCVSLCNSCHIKTNYHRKHWITFFQNLLAERYNYKYNNQEIVLELNSQEIK